MQGAHNIQYRKGMPGRMRYMYTCRRHDLGRAKSAGAVSDLSFLLRKVTPWLR